MPAALRSGSVGTSGSPQKYGDDLHVLGIAYKDSPANARLWLRREGANYPAVMDGNEVLAEEFWIQGIPRFVLLTPDRRLSWDMLGSGGPGYRDSVEVRLAEMLGASFPVDWSPCSNRPASRTIHGGARKTRPCVVVSPDDLNAHLSTFIVAPMTTGGHPCPFRLPCRFERKDGFIVLDQLRTVVRGRLVKRLGRITPGTLSKVLRVLQEMFAE